jgi:N-acyl-D-amino-acid deacylase
METRPMHARLPLLCLTALVTACAHAGRGGSDAAYDVVITNGRVVDGTGAAWFYGDVALAGGRIARVTPAGMLANASARERIDARGMVVAPGFIDIQAQSYGPLLTGDGRVVSMSTQGVTTMILGEGTTPAPVNAHVLALADFAGDTTFARAIRGFGGARGFGAWLDAMDRHPKAVNVGSFLGAATVRAYAKGEAEGPATAAELDTMRRVVRDAMHDGAFGVASALIYPPGSYASTEELVEAAKAMAPYGGVYITHMRSEGDRLVEAVDEAIRIGREGGVPVEIYHLKAAGVRNWPKAAQVLAKIDSARAAGQDVAADEYPYVAGSNNLTSCIPPWAHADGKLLERLADPAQRKRIHDEMLREDASWESLCVAATPAGVQVVGFTKPELTKYDGMRLPQIAQALGTDWADAVITLSLAERGQLGQVLFLMSDANVALQMQRPWMKFGTDAAGLDPEKERTVTHPRAYGTFPRILGKYVREDRVLTLEDAVRKMTSAVATRLAIPDRGVLRAGMRADVVVFDPATVVDRATFEKPHQLSVGVREVFVNGVATVRGGAVTGATPGMIVRGAGYGR